MIKLGLFDAGEIMVPVTKLKANKRLDDLFATIVAADKLGYSRYWLGEHYEKEIAWHSTETLLPILAGLTERIRVGPAGVLLDLHHPLHVALNFKMLEYCYSGRIDMGVAKGTAQPTIRQEFLLGNNEFESKVRKLMQYMDAPEVTSAVTVPPYYEDIPDVWILGGSKGAVDLAVEFKTNFCFSLFHFHADKEKTLEMQRVLCDLYTKAWGVRPRYSVSVAGTCSKPTAELRAQLETYLRGFVSTIQGDAAACCEQLTQLADLFETDEIIFMDIEPNADRRIENMTRMSEVLQLSKA